eukprot:5859577-Pyramimonas_sp.AAC.1
MGITAVQSTRPEQRPSPRAVQGSHWIVPPLSLCFGFRSPGQARYPFCRFPVSGAPGPSPLCSPPLDPPASDPRSNKRCPP